MSGGLQEEMKCEKNSAANTAEKIFNKDRVSHSGFYHIWITNSENKAENGGISEKKKERRKGRPLFSCGLFCFVPSLLLLPEVLRHVSSVASHIPLLFLFFLLLHLRLLLLLLLFFIPTFQTDVNHADVLSDAAPIPFYNRKEYKALNESLTDRGESSMSPGRSCINRRGKFNDSKLFPV